MLLQYNGGGGESIIVYHMESSHPSTLHSINYKLNKS